MQVPVKEAKSTPSAKDAYQIDLTTLRVSSNIDDQERLYVCDETPLHSTLYHDTQCNVNLNSKVCTHNTATCRQGPYDQCLIEVSRGGGILWNTTDCPSVVLTICVLGTPDSIKRRLGAACWALMSQHHADLSFIQQPRYSARITGVNMCWLVRAWSQTLFVPTGILL